VEKIRVRFDTVAKKVDVRALKESMWARLAALQGAERLPPIRHGDVEKEFRARAAAAEGGANSAAFRDPTLASAAAAEADAAVAAAPASRARGGGPPALPLPAGNEDATFAAVIRHMSSEMAAAGVDAASAAAITVPFYFITVLHLANEHGLALASGGHAGGPAVLGDEVLSDFGIRRLTA
jgi:hypothetical protein